MTLQVRAHFDGRAIIPDEPLDVPINKPLMVQVSVPGDEPANASKGVGAFERLLGRVVKGAEIPGEALRRENLYEGR